MHATGIALQLSAALFVAAWVVIWYPPGPAESLWDLPAGWLPAGSYLAGPPPQPARVPVVRLDLATLPADEAEHLDEGEGSVMTILHTPDDPDLLSDRERQAAVDAWVNEPAPVERLDWSRVDEALRRFLAPLDTVERAQVDVDSTSADPVVIPSWRTAGTIEHTGEIPRTLIGASA